MSKREDIEAINSGDVIRARRIGNRTVGTYTIERVAVTNRKSDDFFRAYAHRRYSQKRDEFMVFYANTVRVITSYR